MTVFVDTSALYALLDEDDRYHGRARAWLSGPGRDPLLPMVTHSYVVVESAALVHRRLGHDAVRVLFGAHLRAMSIEYVDEPLHRAASSAYLASLRRRTSFVDYVSFELMRHAGIQQAFTFDDDFADQGFQLLG